MFNIFNIRGPVTVWSVLTGLWVLVCRLLMPLRVKHIQRRALASLAISAFAANAYAVPVSVEVNWPNWSSDNQVIIRDPAGNILQTICDPSNCFNAAANTSYTQTFNYNFPVGTNYTIEMNDAFGDAWNGTNPFVRIFSDGVLAFNDNGPATNTETQNFNVSNSTPVGPQLCYGRPYQAMNFSAPTLISGTALQAGARYRYSSVITNTDAIVEIVGFSNGGSLNSFDTDTGLINNFQPELVSTGGSSVDFRIDFINSITSAPTNFDFLAAAIDVDGNGANLREYVEFNRSSDTYAVNNPTELDIDASGPSTPLRRRFESRTLLTAPGIDPTAEQNIAVAFYTSKSGFDYRFGSLDAGTGTRLTSLGFDCPTLSNPVFPVDPSYDYADAPAVYGNPRHTLVNGVLLGTINNADSTGYNDPNANVDSGDDGVTIPSLTQGQAATITVNASGAGGFLQGWIDWNGDNDFNDTGEQIATNVTDANNDGVITIPVMPPSNAVTTQTFARFRWSTTSGLDSTANANDGEVEDYAVSISPSIAPTPVCPATGQNIGTNGTVGQSSTGSGGLASRANDGNTDGTYNNGSVSATQIENSPWWNLDLGSDSDIDTIDVWNRTDCCTNRLDNFYLFTSATPFPNTGDNPADLNTISNDPNIFKYQHTGTPSQTTTIPVVETHRYVRIQLPAGNEILSLAEVQVNVCLPGIEAAKSIEVYDPTNIGLYALPGNDVIYTITATNTGGGAADADTIEIVDVLPPEIEFWNGDIDDGGPESFPVAFAQLSGSGISLTYSTDVRFGTGTTKPANFAACSVISPDNSYRPDLTYICLNPKGTLAAGDPDPSIALSFRTRIK